MKIYATVFVLVTLSFIACQQITEKPLLSEAGFNLPFKTNPPTCEENAQATASAANIIFKSADGGQNWQDISAGLPKDAGISRIYADESQIFLCSGKKMFYSTVMDPVPYWESEMLLEKDVEVSNVFPGENGSYFTSYANGIFHKIPGTSVLIPIHNTLKDKTVRTMLEISDGNLLVGCESGIYKSTDGGKNWNHVYSEGGVNSFAAAEGVVICGTYEGLLRSTDGGEHWDKILTDEGPAFKTGFENGRFIMVTQGGKNWQDHPANKLYNSVDGGKTWQRMDENLSQSRLVYQNYSGDAPIHDIHDLKQAGKYLFCSCDAGIFRSADWGNTWEVVFPISDKKTILNLAISGEMIYAVAVIGC